MCVCLCVWVCHYFDTTKVCIYRRQTIIKRKYKISRTSDPIRPSQSWFNQWNAERQCNYQYILLQSYFLNTNRQLEMVEGYFTDCKQHFKCVCHEQWFSSSIFPAPRSPHNSCQSVDFGWQIRGFIVCSYVYSIRICVHLHILPTLQWYKSGKVVLQGWTQNEKSQ